MVWEVVAGEDACLLACQGHLMGYFLDNSLIEDGLVKEDQGVAHHQSEEHTIENTHPCVEEEEEDTAEHDDSTHQVGLPCLRASLPSREDRHVIIHQVVVDVLELNQRVNVLIDLGAVVAKAE